MKISKLIIATLVMASLSSLAQDEKPITCGNSRPKVACKKPVRKLPVKKDSMQKAQNKKPVAICAKCGMG